jgi:hypothetical protein
MMDLSEQGRTPKEGSGYILQPDPEQRSLKEAFKVLMFVGASIESMWYQKAVELKSKTFVDNADGKSVPKKLELIGITDPELLEQVKLYYSARRQIVHEKIHDSSYKKNIYTAQKEATKAVHMLRTIRAKIESING